MDALAAELKKHGLFLNAGKYNGTAGGLYASGKDRAFNATVTGLEVMTAKGDAARFGGKFVKNAAGYSITRLLAGSEGAYMLVTSLTLKVYKEKPKTRAAVNPGEAAPPRKLALALKKALDFKNQLNPGVYKEAEHE
jgi:FAD/FMN-containing dehydrogenase